MSVCMCVCVCVCVCVHACVHTCVHACIHVYVCICVCVCACMCVYACVHGCMCVCVCMLSHCTNIPACRPWSTSRRRAIPPPPPQPTVMTAVMTNTRKSPRPTQPKTIPRRWSGTTLATTSPFIESSKSPSFVRSSLTGGSSISTW